MVKKKGFKKFDISNKLAYTLMVVLSIALLGIGVFAYGGTVPTTMGHSAGELNLDWGASTICDGTAKTCELYNVWEATACNSQLGCGFGCYSESGNDFEEVTCGDLSLYNCRTLSENQCYWDDSDPYNEHCAGTWVGTVTCSDIFDQYECAAWADIGICNWGCSGGAYGCWYFTTQSTCTGTSGQDGCSWRSVDRKVTPTSKGVYIPFLNSDKYCNSLGGNCFQGYFTEATTPTDVEGLWEDVRNSRESSSTCPAGTYVYKVSLVQDHYDHNSNVVKAYCKSLPVISS